MLLLIVISLASGWLYWQKYIKNTVLVADYGGDYTEGMVVNAQENVKSVNDKLTKIGLVMFNKDGQIEPALAVSWEISDDQKTYTFHLKNLVNSQELADIIKKEKSNWQDQNIAVKVPDEKTIQFVLSQPFSPFLASLTEPVFPYGPYQIKKESKQEIIFQAREDFFLAKPYLKQLNIKIYPDQGNLIQALKNQEIEGIAELTPEIPRNDRFNIYKMPLPRYLMLFFNLNSQAVADQGIRQKLANNESLDKEVALDLVTTDNEKNISKAEEIKQKWASLNCQVNLIIKDTKELQKDIIPNRQYDVLLFGLDYGQDPDPYPFWHSSQATSAGLNLSNFSNVDADKLLEEARQTTIQEERNKKYAEFQKILDEEKPVIILEQINWQYAVTKKVKGVIADHQGISSADRYFEVWKWYIKEKRVKR